MKKNIKLLLVILWMIFIFVMSSFNANDSSNQSNFIVNIIANIFKINDISLLSFIIRKLAHFTEYFILGVLLYNYLLEYHKSHYLGIVICLLYAISDEVHQLFVIGRSCQVRDIIIDCLGSIIGIYLFKRIRK